MKTVLLQMEDEAYEMLMKKIQKIADTEEFCLDSAELQNIAYLFLALVEKSEPLDDLANGEVIQKVFSNAEVEKCNKDVDGTPHLYRVHGLDGVTDFTADWWKRKWGK